MTVKKSSPPSLAQRGSMTGNPLTRLILSLLFFSIPATACVAQSTAPPASVSAETAQAEATQAISPRIAPVWDGLVRRLAKDGISGPRVDAFFATLAASPTQSPMGRKIRELYNRRFFPSPRGKQQEKYYKGVVTRENASLCRQYIHEHQAAFDHAWRAYGVPPAIGSALLFVETRLGRVLADIPENAFYTLASMAISTRLDDISQWLPRLKGYEKHTVWIDETMRKRADWAYREVRALVQHMLTDNIQPDQLPGSIYGAVGLCQFMPSNISVYGADGDGDGRVNLFTDADAIASLANYLARHGWKRDMSREAMHRLLMTYNHSTVYANTILALGDLVANPSAQQLPRGAKDKQGKTL